MGKDKTPKEATANKKPIFIQLEFKGDDIATTIKERLRSLFSFTKPTSTNISHQNRLYFKIKNRMYDDINIM